MVELAAWLWVWLVGACLTYHVLAGVQSDARVGVQTALLLLWVWTWPAAVPLLVAYRRVQKHRARCRHYGTATTTYIGRNPEPFVKVITQCVDCGVTVSASDPWSGRQMQLLLMRADMMEPGTWQIVHDPYSQEQN